MVSKNLFAGNLNINNNISAVISNPKVPACTFEIRLNTPTVAPIIPVRHCCCENPTKLAAAHFNAQAAGLEASAGWSTERC